MNQASAMEMRSRVELNRHPFEALADIPLDLFVRDFARIHEIDPDLVADPQFASLVVLNILLGLDAVYCGARKRGGASSDTEDIKQTLGDMAGGMGEIMQDTKNRTPADIHDTGDAIDQGIRERLRIIK